jgi:hypothetical protein
VQPVDAACVRLDLGDLIGPDPAQPRDAVGSSSALELVQPLQLGAVGGDDDLAAALAGQALALAVLVHLVGPLHAQPSLQRAGDVVDAGVDHARVVPRLVDGELRLALEHADARAGTASQQLAGDREAEDAAADHGDVAAVGSLAHRRVIRGRPG